MTTAAFDPRIGDVARSEHRHLLDVAFRMLGDLGRAEDMVQEAFVRLARADLDTIHDVRGWLVVVVGRLCLDHLRSASTRREHATEQSMLELAAPASARSRSVSDPADRVTLDETVRAALLAVLERLTPPERTAFVLHDVFQFPFDTIGSIVGRTPTACRQLASRARQRLRAESVPIRSHIETPEHRVVVERFMATAAGGDLGALMEVLDPDVTGDGTPGGVITAAAPPSHGPERVGRRVIGYVGPQTKTTLVSSFVNDQPAVLVTRDGRIIVVLLLDIRDGLIEHMHAVGDPIGLANASADQPKPTRSSQKSRRPSSPDTTAPASPGLNRP
jgi:RNA polymerase sigma-70 factor (ECF subfamily)